MGNQVDTVGNTEEAKTLRDAAHVLNEPGYGVLLAQTIPPDWWIAHPVKRRTNECADEPKELTGFG
jgi:hypothetical protein